ncbi:Beta-glucuronidase [Tolypocladium capitatum]|uniref:Beta-glucuronidase n=1 Tax=Tolypocladium capitatum TaxID=45235 RepID=A0A2K3QA48_9HYPO|nr:Beta-glucuronidase [Tolypocladium capitatum]
MPSRSELVALMGAAASAASSTCKVPSQPSTGSEPFDGFATSHCRTTINKLGNLGGTRPYIRGSSNKQDHALYDASQEPALIGMVDRGRSPDYPITIHIALARNESARIWQWLNTTAEVSAEKAWEAGLDMEQGIEFASTRKWAFSLMTRVAPTGDARLTLLKQHQRRDITRRHAAGHTDESQHDGAVRRQAQRGIRQHLPRRPGLGAAASLWRGQLGVDQGKPGPSNSGRRL